MRLTDLVNAVTSTTADDWETIPPPFGLYEFSEVSDATDNWLEIRYHHGRFVLRDDIAIGLAVGLPTSWSDDNLTLPELGHFPDTTIRGRYADLLYNGQPVKRYYLICVDGGRALLPMPNTEVAPSGARFGMEGFASTATASEVALARLVNSLDGGRDYDLYLERAEIIEVPDPK